MKYAGFLHSHRCRRFVPAIVWFVLSVSVCGEAQAGWFGPDTYDECILDAMRGVTSDIAAREIRAACRNQYPPQPVEKKPEPKTRLLTPAEFERLQGKSARLGAYFSADLYNGNEFIKIHEIEFKHRYTVDGEKQYQVYKEKVFIDAQDVGSAFFRVVDGADGWSFDKAWGVPVDR
ncbi:MAG: hypothetical protein ACJ0Q1_09870 [Luminiphilus sp.]